MRFILCGLVCLVLIGCGPESSNMDKETEQIDQLYQKNKEIMDAIAGDYDGEIEGLDGRKIKATLRLRSFSIFVNSVNRVEVIEIPNLIGFVTFASTDQATINFSQGNFDKRSQTLRLYGTSERDGTFYFMQLKYDGRNLVGEYLQRRLTSQVNFRKKRN